MIKKASAVLATAVITVCLVACGGGGSGDTSVTPPVSPPATGVFTGVAAVGAPIANGTVNIVCAGGSANSSVATDSTGAWSATVTGQTLPCAIQVSGGSVNSVANTVRYHSVATTYGTANVTPLTDLLVTNLSGSATPSTWFSALTGASAPLSAITQTSVAAALAKLQTNMPSLVSLSTVNPITTSFTAVAGNLYEQTLIALQTAIANSGVAFATLQGNAAVSGFMAPPAGFTSALSAAYSDAVNGPATPAIYSWATGGVIAASGAISTYTPSVASLANGKAMAVFAQSESTGVKVYAVRGDYATAMWSTPVAMTGFSGTVTGVSNSSGWNQPTTSTVVTGDVVTGNALAAWTSHVTGESTYRVWMSSYNAATGIWSNATQIGASAQISLKTATSATGGMAISWIQPSTIGTGKIAMATYLSSTGTSVTDTLEMGNALGNGWKVGLSNANDLVAVWSGPNSQMLFARRGTPSWTSPVAAGAGYPSLDANLSLSVGADGSAAALWSGLDTSIHSAVFDSTGTLRYSTALSVGSNDNTRPSVAALPNGKFVAIFGASNMSGSSTLVYELATCYFDFTNGWSKPIITNSNGDVGDTHLVASTGGVVVAVAHGYNEYTYQLSSTGALLNSHLIYHGNVPAITMDPSTGRTLIIWTNGSQLDSSFFH